MTTIRAARALATFIVGTAGILLGTAGIAAADLSKDQCVDAHSRGQDARETGKLTLARKLFLTCAVPSCPTLVQGDCARYADDLGRVQPSITFAARDARGSDLPDTTVYVDDSLVATRLDGEPYDVDPGKHVIRFQRGRDEQSITVVVNTGEKGRAVVAAFAAPVTAAPPTVITGSPTTTTQTSSATVLTKSSTSHPVGAKVLLGVGGAALVAGTVIAVYGYTSLPAGCTLGDHQCTAPPGDPRFTDASDKVKIGNIGLVVGGVGLAAVVTGLVWYAKGATTHESSTQPGAVGLAPYVTPSGAGLVLSGHL